MKFDWILHGRDKFWVIVAIGASFAVAGFTYSLPLPKGDDILYLLSSVSQGLAAIFTLVFAITIFGAQMMRNFTAMDKIIDKWTKIFMIIFAIGIILPLMQLSTDKDILHLDFINTANLGLAMDLGITTFCVLAIIPYLMRVNRIMKYEGGISRLSEETSEAIDSDYPVTALNRISELAELGKSAVDDALISETRQIIHYIECFGLVVIGKKWEGATQEVVKGLGEIGVKAADKKLSTSLITEAITKLTNIGLKALDEDMRNDNDIFTISYDSLFEIGSKVILRNLRFHDNPTGLIIRSRGTPEVLEEDYTVVENLKKLANKAYEIDKDKFDGSIKIIMEYLWVLGALIKKYLPEEYAEDMAEQLKKSNVQVIKDLFGSNYIRKDAMLNIKEWMEIKDIKELKDELQAFGELYDKI